MLDWKFYR